MPIDYPQTPTFDESLLIPIGILIILVGIVILIISLVLSVFKSRQARAEGGFIFWIGPIPVMGFATSRNIFYILLVTSVILIVIFLIFGRKIIS